MENPSVAGIYARQTDTLNRPIQLGLASGRLISVSFPPSVPEDAETAHPLLDRLAAYLDGTEDTFSDVEVALTLPTDQRRVLENARNVPYGETIAIDRLARLAGLDDEDEDDIQLVRTALANNPVPVVIPDHRISDAPGATPSTIAAQLRELEA